MGHNTKGTKPHKPTFADMLAELDEARADVARYDAITNSINEIKAAELARYSQHFARSPEDKARLLLLGWQEGGPGPKGLSQHFPERGSFLEHECRWAIAELLLRGDSPTLRLVASLFVPDDNHPFTHAFLTARLVRRRPGALANVRAVEQIVSAVATFERWGLQRDGAVNEVADWYQLSREYVYRCLRQSQ